MPQHSSLGEWLRFLSATAPESARWQQPAARTALRRLVKLGKLHMLAGIGAMSSAPLVVADDGVVRMVTAMQSLRYGYNRRDKSFFAALREEDGSWRFVPQSDPNVVIFDTYLPLRAWRRRIRYTLRAELHETLVGLVVPTCGNLSQPHLCALDDLCAEIVNRAWTGLRMRKRLTRRFPTKRLRHQLREAMAVDPDLLALARAARFRASQPGITQRWLSFVWQHHGTLTRIRQQTPALLRPVAQHMFQYPANPCEDPTRACVKTLISNGMSKRSFQLLGRRGDRPFREVIRRFNTGYALDALLLALRLTESGHDAVVARPLFYRVTLDEFGCSMTPAGIRNRLAVLPGRVFTEARARLALATDELEAQEIALAYRGIVNWFVTYEPEGHEHASWDRWLVLVREAEDRRRATLEPATWPCALEELRTPDAEVLALATPLALFEEGRALRHCAYSYVSKCRDDQARLFSARMWHHGRIERATIGLWREPRGWRIWDIRGPCNRRMGGHWIPLARQVAEAYTRNSALEQLALPMRYTWGE
ncbi:PcfJ domain-containing protein [Thermomonas sp. RSS23]|uniref:PcfJ domain-containing protein n=1 Tax=Thermomonas beijingensis TaxID=2872701 RepID=A0ABS7TAA5_9GAMM|nr:PcfJ domain-containing protein [Thermomonas beijingensis]MBZ4184777.1 PcfJ domain-containing protein [Thermomonas beijingensis]